MPILIKDMEMPTSCCECRFHYGADLVFGWNDLCAVKEKSPDMKINPGTDRPDWCPLVEVKRPKYDAQLLRDCGMED